MQLHPAVITAVGHGGVVVIVGVAPGNELPVLNIVADDAVGHKGAVFQLVCNHIALRQLRGGHPGVYADHGAHGDVRLHGAGEDGEHLQTEDARSHKQQRQQHNERDLINIGNEILDSFLKHGFTGAGFFYDDVNFDHGFPLDEKVVHSIRQQSEAVYAILLYLKYEKSHGRKHTEWEKHVQTILDSFLKLQKSDGSFARKFHDDGTDIDSSGGSTPSATSTLVMGYRYFGKKQYLEAARRTIDYLEKNIISKSDYFSSTLDANCEDKEAAISAVTANYYMAAVTKGKERQRYIELCREAAYFALSWYYLWDVPFAQGQMLGDLGLKSRGWSNVSVENNHIDVFVFELPHIVKWLGQELGDKRFMQMYDVIFTSLSQLMPTTERNCGIAMPGFYPEVVQHTAWDYGMNGKGFYNNLFAPGWTIASLWELYSPERTDNFLKK